MVSTNLYFLLVLAVKWNFCRSLAPYWRQILRGNSPCYTESRLPGVNWDEDAWGDETSTPTKFRSRRMPLPYVFPEVGNGHVATVVLRDSIFMNGLYNGELGQSHRARIPATNNLFCIYGDASLKDVIHELDVANGIFSQTFVTEFYNLTHKSYAHRVTKELLVASLEFKRTNRQKDVENITIYNDDGSRDDEAERKDIQFVETTVRPARGDRPGIIFSEGKTTTPERPWTPPAPTTQTVFRYHHDLSDGTGAPGTGKVLQVEPDEWSKKWTFLTSISSSKSEAWKSFLFGQVQATTNNLEDSHKDAWTRFTAAGTIQVKGPESLKLAQAINGALYYLKSSLPLGRNNTKWPFFGLSPGGLAHGDTEKDYLGHVFWDQDTWMYPPFLLLHSDISRQLMSARTRIVKESQVKARRYGYEGAMYPWEAAFTGADVCPGESYIKSEVHVTADVAFALRQYLYATNDTSILTDRDTNGAHVVQEIARFWGSRLSRSRVDPDKFSLRDVMCPDEYGWGDDNGFTNYGAKLALQLPDYALPLIGRKPINDSWTKIAENITMLFDPERNYHPEYTQYRLGQQVKQADVILLGYPLMMKMSRAVRKNDLSYYENVTDPNGPAMTWGMFSVGWLELGNKAKGASLFAKNFNYIQEPFKVWTETSYRAGAVNFLTGMGGFLQAIMFGFGGLRLNSHCLFLCPTMLPNVTEMTFVGIDYQQYSMDIQVKGNHMFVTLTDRSPDSDRLIYLRRRGYGPKWMYYLRQKYTFVRGPALIYTKAQEDYVKRHEAQLLDQVNCLT